MKKCLLVVLVLGVLLCNTVSAEGFNLKEKRMVRVLSEAFYFNISPIERFSYYGIENDLEKLLVKIFDEDVEPDYWTDRISELILEKHDVWGLTTNINWAIFELPELDAPKALFFKIYYGDGCSTRMVFTRNFVKYIFFDEENNKIEDVSYSF